MGVHRQRPETASRIALPWIVRLRYGMAFGQVATALIAEYALRIDLPPSLDGASTASAASQQFSARKTGVIDCVGLQNLDSNTCGLDFLSGYPLPYGDAHVKRWAVQSIYPALSRSHPLAATILTKRQTWRWGDSLPSALRRCSGYTAPCQNWACIIRAISISWGCGSALRSR